MTCVCICYVVDSLLSVFLFQKHTTAIFLRINDLFISDFWKTTEEWVNSNVKMWEHMKRKDNTWKWRWKTLTFSFGWNFCMPDINGIWLDVIWLVRWLNVNDVPFALYSISIMWFSSFKQCEIDLRSDYICLTYPKAFRNKRHMKNDLFSVPQKCRK